MEQTKQMSSGGLKSNDTENYVECKCSVLQLKDRNQNSKKKKKKPKQIITTCKKHTFKTKMQKSKKTENMYTM